MRETDRQGESESARCSGTGNKSSFIEIMFLEVVSDSFQVFDESTHVTHVWRRLPLERIENGLDENHGAAGPDGDVLPVEILVDT